MHLLQKIIEIQQALDREPLLKSRNNSSVMKEFKVRNEFKFNFFGIFFRHPFCLTQFYVVLRVLLMMSAKSILSKRPDTRVGVVLLFLQQLTK